MVLIKNLTQTQINSISTNLTGEVITNTDVNKLMFNNGSGFNYLVFSDLSNAITGLASISATDIIGTLQTAEQPNITSVGTLTGLTSDGNVNIASHNGTTTGLKLAGNLVTATAAELNYVDTTPGTAEAGKALVLDENLSIVGLSNLETDNLTVNGTLVTSSAIELNYVDINTLGVAQASKALVVDADKNITGINNLEANHIVVNGTLVTSSAIELNYVDVTTLGTAEANKALVVDSNRDIGNIRNLVADNLTGTLQTAAQPNVTSVGTLTGLDVSGDTSLASLTVAGVPLNAFNTGGLKLRVYSGPDFNGRVIKADVANSVDFTDYEPVSGVTENYSMEIWGYIKPQYTESYTFTVTSNDNFRLWINNQLVRVGWTSGDHNNLQTTPIELTADAWYPIYIQHVQLTSNERLSLVWSSTSQVSQSVPSAAMAYDDKLINVAARTTYVQDKFNLYDSVNSNITSFEVNSSGDLNLTSFSNNFNVVGHDGSSKGLQLNGTLVTSTAVELNYVDVTPGTASASKALVVNSDKDIANIRNITTIGNLGLNTSSASKQLEVNSATGDVLRLTYNNDTGTATNYSDFNVSSSGNLTIKASGLTTLVDSSNNFDVAGHDGSTLGLKLAGVLVTSTAVELNYVDVTPGTATASKALVLDADKNISTINELTAVTLNSTNFTTDNLSTSTLNTTGNVGINTTDLTYGLQVNEASGNILRLMYNDGEVDVHSEFTMNSSSDLIITTQGSTNIATHNGTSVGLKLAGVLVTSTATELNYVDVTPGTADSNKALVLDNDKNIIDINSVTALEFVGTLQTASQPNVTSVGTLTGLVSNGDVNVASHDGSTVGLKLAGVLVTSTAAELNYVDVTPGTADSNKALVLDSSRNITNVNNVLTTGKIGINTSSPDKQLEVNSATGDALRLSNNDNDGTAANYADFNISSSGNLTINSSGLTTYIDSSNSFDVVGHNGLTMGLKLAGVLVTSTAAQLNYVNVVPGDATASKALVLDSNKDITGIRNLSVTGTLSMGGTLSLSSTADAVDETDGGAFTSSGGGAFAKSVYIGNDLHVLEDSYLGGNVTVTGPSLVIPTGNTASRPSPAADGQVRYNSETQQFEGFGAGGTWGSLGGVVNVEQTTKILAEFSPGSGDNNLRFITDSVERLRVGATGKIGINTSNPDKQLEINSSSGEVLRLTYDDNDGTAENYADFNVSSTGSLTMKSSGLTTLVDSSNSFDVAGHNGSTLGLKLAGVLVTATAAELNTLDGITATTTELNLLDGVTATTTELNYVDTTPGTAVVSKALVVDGNVDIVGIHALSADELTGTLQTVAQPNVTSVGILNSLISNGNVDIAEHNGTTIGLKLSGVLVTSTAAELNYVDVTAIGSAQASKALVVDANRDIGNIRNISNNGFLGVNTTAPSKQVEINSATGDVLRLTYDNNNGTATNYSDFKVSIDGNLIIKSSGLTTLIESTNNFDIEGHDGSSLGLKLAGVLVTANAAELNYVDVSQGVGVASKALVLDSNKDIESINALTAVTLNATHVVTDDLATTTINTTGNVGINTTDLTFGLQVNEATGNVLRLTYDGPGAEPSTHADFTMSSTGDLTINTQGNTDISTHNGSTIGLKLAGVLVTSTAAELNYVDVTPGTATASKALVLNSSLDVTGINSLSATSLTGTLQTASQPNVTSVGTLTGLVSNGNVDIASHDGSTVGLKLAGVLVTSTAAELNYVDVTAGTASASKALVLDGDKNITGINTLSMNNLNLTYDSSVANTSGIPLTVSRTTSGTPANGLGVGVSFLVENSANSNVEFGNVNVVASDITSDSEDGQFVVNLMTNGVMTEALRVDSTTIYATQLYETSDRRVKENIVDVSLEETHERVMSLHLVDYNYIGENTSVVHRGLIAQEIQEVIPVAVNESKKDNIDDFKSVSNREVTNHLIGSVQYLSKKLDEMMSKYEQLSSDFEQYKNTHP